MFFLFLLFYFVGGRKIRVGMRWEKKIDKFLFMRQVWEALQDVFVVMWKNHFSFSLLGQPRQWMLLLLSDTSSMMGRSHHLAWGCSKYIFFLCSLPSYCLLGKTKSSKSRSNVYWWNVRFDHNFCLVST